MSVTKFDEGLYLGRFLYSVGATTSGEKFVTIGGTGLSVPFTTHAELDGIMDYYEDNAEVENGILFVYLDEMPFDKDGRHATGRAWYDSDNDRWVNEYESEEE